VVAIVVVLSSKWAMPQLEFRWAKTTMEKADLEIGASSACINGQNRIDPMGKTTLEKFTPAGTSRTK
jgi:hypothetical protein